MMLRTCLRPLALTATLALALGSFQAFAQEAAAPPAAQATGEKVKLELNLTKGASFETVMKVTATQNMNFGGMEMTSETETNTVVVTTVDSIGDGGATVKSKTRRIHGHSTNPMAGQFDFDTDNKDQASTGNPQFDEMLQSMQAATEKETVSTISKDGTMTDAPKDDAAAAMLRALGAIDRLPKDAVGVGDTWTTESETTTRGIKTKTKTKNTVKAIDAESVTVTHEGTVDLDLSAGIPGMPPAIAEKVTVKPGKVTGESKVSRKLGLLLVSDVTSQIDMEIAADENNPMLAAGGTITNLQKFHQERKLVPTPAAAPATPATPAETEKK